MVGAFHAIAVPEADMLEKSGTICVVARGDGVVDVIDIRSELAVAQSKSSLKAQKGSKSRSKNRASTTAETLNQNGRRAFSLFGERGKSIISGGNDKTVKIWDCSRHLDAWQPNSSNDILHLNINLSKEVNYLCSTPTDSENLVVCDTTKVVKVYTIS